MDDTFRVSMPIMPFRGDWVPAIDIYEVSDAVYVMTGKAGVDK
jgi:HSP20 family molecular chaperone IbpA